VHTMYILSELNSRQPKWKRTFNL